MCRIASPGRSVSIGYAASAFRTAAYGCWPVRHTPSDVLYAGVHTRDERIHVDDLGYALEFTLHACRAVGAMTR